MPRVASHVGICCWVLCLTTKSTSFLLTRTNGFVQKYSEGSGLNDDNRQPRRKQQSGPSTSFSSLGSKEESGDPLRSSTGIRPSLHPITINAISNALLIRSRQSVSSSTSSENEVTIDAYAENANAINVAIAAGQIATEALEKRKKACSADGSDDEAPNTEEGQVVAGRVVGVVMRMRDLESTLVTKASKVSWIGRYNEYGSFGVLKSECELGDGCGVELGQMIVDDPLFRMCRAECLLALFMHSIEIPKLEMIGESLAGGSDIDFIDSERLEVILGD